MERFKVVICGAGIAGVEALLRLRRLAGDQVDITLLNPRGYLDYRPLAVAESFGDEQVQRFPLDRIAADTGARWLPDSLGWVDRTAQLAFTSTGEALPYDALLLSLGGRPCPTSPFMEPFNSRHGAGMYREILAAIDSGRVSSLAFVVPEEPSWPLPLYELAFLTAQRVAARAQDVELTFITPAAAPLAVFGPAVSERITEVMDAAGIRLCCNCSADMPARRRLVLVPSGVELRPERTVTLQRITGPDVPGIPGDARGRFLDIDERCRVRHAGGRIFAAGDATNSPVKHGGLSAQQGDTAAAGIAHLAGCAPLSRPLYPVLCAALRTGEGFLYLTADLIAGQGWHGRIDDEPPWDDGHKVVAAELGPYLDGIA